MKIAVIAGGASVEAEVSRASAAGVSAALKLAGHEVTTLELDRALAHTGEVLAITERGGAHELRCRAKNLCGAIYEQRGQFDISARYYSASLELARTIGDDLEEERARAAIGFRRLLEGDLYAAGRDFDELLTQAQSRGEKLRISGYINALGIIAHEQGRYDEAERIVADWQEAVAGSAWVVGTSSRQVPGVPTLDSRAFAEQAVAHDMLSELISINTVHEQGTLKAAEALKARFLAAGFSESDLTLVAIPEHPNQAQLVVIY